jgi:predicted lactoylglutathione lyase
VIGGGDAHNLLLTSGLVFCNHGSSPPSGGRQRSPTGKEQDMPTNIFVNLPTSDLDRAKAYYTALGCDINPNFTDDNAACIVWSDDIYFMVLTKEYFSTFTDKEFADPRTHAQVLLSISRDSRDAVDQTIEAGVANGGTAPGDPQDYGFMYARDLIDPDGNGVQFMWMAPEAVANGPAAYMAEQAQA